MDENHRMGLDAISLLLFLPFIKRLSRAAHNELKIEERESKSLGKNHKLVINKRIKDLLCSASVNNWPLRSGKEGKSGG